MTMPGPYGDYPEEETADLVRSLALSSAKLWEELFERLRRLELAQTDLRELVARIEAALPAALESPALAPAEGRAENALPLGGFSSSLDGALATVRAEIEAAAPEEEPLALMGSGAETEDGPPQHDEGVPISSFEGSALPIDVSVAAALHSLPTSESAPSLSEENDDLATSIEWHTFEPERDGDDTWTSPPPIWSNPTTSDDATLDWASSDYIARRSQVDPSEALEDRADDTSVLSVFPDDVLSPLSGVNDGAPPPPPGFVAADSLAEAEIEMWPTPIAGTDDAPPPPPIGFDDAPPPPPPIGFHDAPPPPPPIGFHDAPPPPPAAFHLDEAPPPPIGFHVDGAPTGFHLDQAPPPPPAGFHVDEAPTGFHVDQTPPPPPPSAGFQFEAAPPPPPAWFRVDAPPSPSVALERTPTDATATVVPSDEALPRVGLQVGNTPPPPPPGFTIVRPAQPRTREPLGLAEHTAAHQNGDGSTSDGSGVGGNGDAAGSDDETRPPVITPDFFARAGKRRL